MVYLSTASNSKINTWKTCKWKYYLSYVMKIFDPRAVNPDHLKFGSYIHRVFELGYKCSSLDELKAIAETQWEIYDIHKKYKSDTKKAIENFFKFNAKLKETVGVEIKFDAPILEDLTYNGVIDRLIKSEDGSYLIIDYKTGREKSKSDLLNEDQLKGYARSVQKLYGVPANKITCGLYYPISDTFIHIKYSDFTLKMWEKAFVNEAWNIRKAKEEELKPQVNQYCRTTNQVCSHYYLCPAFNSTKEVLTRIDEFKKLSENKDQSQSPDKNSPPQ